LCRRPIDAPDIRDYLAKLSETIDMVTLIDPVTHHSPMYGWAGWIHWETSGAHFYAWDTPLLFFSVDVYACKPFRDADVVDFTRDFFDSPDVVSRSF
jgi:S-adenosylmethionine decarboxylase